MTATNQNPRPQEAPLSIGGLSRATGIAVETLRTWERRYGFPSPIRTASGHRRYTVDTAERLKRVQAAIARGHRASAVLTCSEDQLEALLAMDDGAAARNDLGASAVRAPDAPAARPEPPPRPRAETDDVIEHWLGLVREFDGHGLDHEMERAWQQRGARAFVVEDAVHMLREIGDRWSRGEISIAHEHFASERLRDFLSRQWRPLTTRSHGPKVVCAALSGEHHSLPLHLSAVLLALEGARPVILGADTPEREVARAATTFSAQAVLVAASRAANADLVYDQLQRLRAALPDDVSIAVGGTSGVLPTGTDRVGRFEELASWARELSRRFGTPR